jgi:predicted membrane GTPase involved in stress response
VEAAQAGDIVVLSGVPVEMVAVADTVCDPSIHEALPTVKSPSYDWILYSNVCIQVA